MARSTVDFNVVVKFFEEDIDKMLIDYGFKPDDDKREEMLDRIHEDIVAEMQDLIELNASRMADDYGVGDFEVKGA
jgi:hypothetical protein